MLLRIDDNPERDEREKRRRDHKGEVYIFFSFGLRRDSAVCKSHNEMEKKKKKKKVLPNHR